MFDVAARGETHGRRARGHSIAVFFVAMCVTTGLAACGQGAPARGRVALLPNHGSEGNSWDWTSACRVGPRIATGCAESAPALGSAQLAGNAWNLGGEPTAGSVNMSVSSSGGVAVKANVSSAPPCTDPACIAPQANTWVRGFPSVLYGIDQCHAKTSPPQSGDLKLPMQVRSIPANLTGTATYDSDASQVTHDVAYDMWLNPSDTKTPCQKDGTIEVMVWTDYDARALLPDGSKVGTTSIPFAVNGNVDTGSQAWSVYVNNVYKSGHTVPWGGTVWLVLDAAHVVKKGTVTVDLSAALNSVGTLLQNNFGWSDFAGSYWLDTIAFGMEFGPQNADPYSAGPTAFSMDLAAYCLEAGTTVSAATC